MDISKKLSLFFCVLFVSVSFAATSSNQSKSPEINPYLSYDGLKADVRNMNAIIYPGFSKTNAEETDYYLVKFKDAVKPEWRNELEKNGATILWYVPYNTYLVKMNTAQAAAANSMSSVYWSGVQQPYFKLSPEIRNLLTAKDLSSAAIDNGRIKMEAVLYAGESTVNVRNAIAGLGTVISEVQNAHNTRVWFTIAPADYFKMISMLAQRKEVEGIELWHRFTTQNDAARWVHQRFVNASYPLYAQNLRGQNQIGGISDTGVDYDMCYFRDAAGAPPFDNQAPFGDVAANYSRRKIVIYNSMDATTCGAVGTPGDDHGHGTHTCGTFVGNNLATACTTGNGSAGDGMALCSQVVYEDMAGALNFINIPCGSVYDVINIAYNYGARVHSNSWGWGCDACPCSGNMYNTDARDVDQFVWEHKDMTMFFAAGNSGGSCGGTSNVGTPSVSKNCCSIGATQHDASATNIAGFSSRGWTTDKRLKPDFCTQGVGTISAANDGNVNSNNCNTTSMSGTSMATPTAASYGLLTRQYYTAGYYPTGSPVPANGFTPSAALVKATMINSAVDMTGVTGLPPNTTEGWGRLTLDNALYFNGYAHKLWVVDQSSGLSTGFSRCYYLSNVSTSQSLKVTLTWSDYPGGLFSDPAIVNDLNLEVTNPAGTTTYHQTLDASYNIVQTTTPSDPQDNRNTVDQILVSSPPAGTWVIKVTGINVPQPPEPYALVVTGDIAGTTQPAVPTGTTATASAANQITVNWTAATGATCYNVYRGNGACPGTAWQKVANCTSATSYQDNTVSAGSTYSYKVTAIYAGSCESDYSTCAQATATGTCTLGPTFAGVVRVVNNTVNPCGVTVQWAAGTSQCASYPTVKYNVYKSTDPAFVPGPSNLAATCQTGTTWNDSDVAAGLTFYYVVRAEDSRSGGGGGPCNGGNFDTNVVKASVTPTGPATTLFTDNAGDSGPAQMLFANSTIPDWTISTARNHTSGGSHSYASGAANNQCAWAYSPSVTLSGGNPIYALDFWTVYNIEAGSDSGIIQVSSDGGTSWTKVTPRQGYPYTTHSAANTCNGGLTTGFTGANLTWTYYDVDLTTYTGQGIQFRFKEGADAGGNYEGWYVDDIRVMGYQACQNGSPTCTSPPIFAGIVSAASAGTASCQVNLAWNTASSTCATGPNIKYHIYRSTDPAFVPGPSNKIAQCVTGTAYADSGVIYGNTYYYVVRAEDSTTNGSGPCNSGNIDTNVVKKSASPTGPPIVGNMSWPFETGLDGWTVTGGTWALSNARVNPGGSTYSVHSSQALNLQCDYFLSPVIQPSGSSTLTIPNWYDTEPFSTYWYDRCNVWAVQGATKTLLTPASGKLYSTGTYYNWSYCNMLANPGWCGAGTSQAWGNSTFDLSAYNGQSIQIEIRYMTDDLTTGEGIYVDDISATNVLTPTACSSGTQPPGKVLNNLMVTKFSGNPVLNWSAVTGTCTITGYGIYRGILPWTAYNHASINCATAGTTYTDSTAPSSYYYLVVPYNATNEGTYGTDSSGTQRPVGASPCKSQNTSVCN